MAVIAQADPYQGLIRKIGYSVGLEKLVERVEKLVAIYVRDKTINAGEFRSLVENDFGRKNAVEHFANFYGTLNLVRAMGRDVQPSATKKASKKPAVIPKNLEPLYLLDALSILRRLFESDRERFSASMKVVLAQSIVEADGDIFLNCLLADFQADSMKILLEGMIHSKRHRLGKVMRIPGLVNKLYQIVDIKNESTADMSLRSEAAPSARFGRRTQSLSGARRTTSLTSTTEHSVNVPSDYLSKVANSRKGWAQDLGFFESSERSEIGKQFLENLGPCTSRGLPPTHPFLFWGYAPDLERLRIKPTDIDAPSCDSWDLLRAIANAHLSQQKERQSSISADELVELLRLIFDLYRSANTKGLIRNSLPLYVAEPVLAAWSVANSRELPRLSEILENEYKSKVRRIQKMIIRGTSGAIFFMH